MFFYNRKKELEKIDIDDVIQYLSKSEDEINEIVKTVYDPVFIRKLFVASYLKSNATIFRKLIDANPHLINVNIIEKKVYEYYDKAETTIFHIYDHVIENDDIFETIKRHIHLYKYAYFEDYGGNTPLIIACHNGDVRLVELFSDIVKDKDTKNKAIREALKLSKNFGKIVEILYNSGADIFDTYARDHTIFSRRIMRYRSCLYDDISLMVRNGIVDTISDTDLYYIHQMKRYNMDVIADLVECGNIRMTYKLASSIIKWNHKANSAIIDQILKRGFAPELLIKLATEFIPRRRLLSSYVIHKLCAIVYMSDSNISLYTILTRFGVKDGKR